MSALSNTVQCRCRGGQGGIGWVDSETVTFAGTERVSVFAAADARRPRSIAIVVGALSLLAVVAAVAVVAAFWRGPDPSGAHLPAYERYDVPLRTEPDSSAVRPARDSWLMPVLVVVAALAVVGTVMVGTGPSRSRRAAAKKCGRWWGVVLIVAVLVVVTGLIAHRYTADTVARDAYVDEVGVALPVGTGPMLEVRPDGIRSVHAPRRRVALTFDDGPDPRWTPAILDVLAREHVPATFFVVGELVVEHPELVRRVLRDGSEIGVHTFRHVDISAQDPATLRRDLRLTQLAIVGATGRRTTLFRPPFVTDTGDVGLRELVALGTVTSTGYLTVLADHDTSDWKRPGVETIVRRAMPADDTGAIIELHDGGGDRSQTVAALTTMIRQLKERGYRFETVSSLARIPTRRVMPAASGLEQSWGRAFLFAMGAAGVVVLGFSILVVLAALLGLLKVAVVLIGAHRSRRRPDAAPAAVGAMPSVSVLVAAFNEAEALPATLRALSELRAAQLEIVVVDDGSTDGTVSVVRNCSDSRVRLICRPHEGKAAALSAGLEQCRGEIVVTIDADTHPDRDALCQIVQPFGDPRVAAVSGNLRVANPSGWLGAAQQLEYVIANAFDRRALGEWETQMTVPGAIGAFRRSALLDVGGFDVSTVAEDTDLTLALVAAGHRVRFSSGARARTQARGDHSRPVAPTFPMVLRHRSGALATESRAAPLAHGPARAATWTFGVLVHVLLPLTATFLDVRGGVVVVHRHHVATGALVAGDRSPVRSRRVRSEVRGRVVSACCSRFRSTCSGTASSRPSWCRKRLHGRSQADGRCGAARLPAASTTTVYVGCANDRRVRHRPDGA